MTDTPQNMQKLREEVELWLTNIDGIIGTGIGRSKDGKDVLKIYTSVPIDTLSLPKPLPAGTELEFVGDIDAQ